MENYLIHHGVLGMKWGILRYQNKDGTRTSLGKKHEAELKNKNKRENKSKKREEKLIAKAEEKARKKVEEEKRDALMRERLEMISKVKNVKKLSDTEIKSLTDRLNAEKRLRELAETELEPGKAFVKKFLKNSASEAFEKISKVVILKGAKEIAKAMGYNDIAEAIFQSPKEKKNSD